MIQENMFIKGRLPIITFLYKIKNKKKKQFATNWYQNVAI